MSWKNIRLIFMREVRDQLRDRRTLFIMTILPVLLYPMLGLGMVEMTLTFSEQRRTVVILNADELPTEPALLTETGIDGRWLESPDDASRLRVVTDSPTSTDSGTTSPRMESSEDVLRRARELADHIAAFTNADTTDAPAESATAAESIDAAEVTEPTDLSTLFSHSGVHVLVLVPDGYADAVRGVQEQALQANSAAGDLAVPNLRIVRNSADDRSVVAFGRVQSAFRNWEADVRRSIFDEASLPSVLQYPAALEWVEVAREEQVSANVWSKLFPAMLVIMALTGAFYPAIDLGAGEKERGTMETLLISPARRVEIVIGKFGTIMLFSVGSALMNLGSMALTGRQMSSSLGGGIGGSFSLEFPSWTALAWVLILLLPLASLFSALCLALATFARSTKEGQYYLNPLLMVVMGLTVFCLSPAVEISPLYSVLPVINVALLLKGMLLTSAQTTSLAAYAIPVLVSSFGYSILALWWAIELYSSENVLLREAEKFDVRVWFRQLLRPRDAVPTFSEAVFCFIGILLLQVAALTMMKPDFNPSSILRLLVVQQLVTICCPAAFMGILMTTSPRATFRLRMPSLSSMLSAVVLVFAVHPLSVELMTYLGEQGVFPETPQAVARLDSLMNGSQPLWMLLCVFALTPAICEELAFRGFILSGLARGGRLAIAIAISSLMFGIVHMIPQQAFNATLLGLLIGLIAVHSRSLFPGIAFHFLTNALNVVYAQGGLSFVPEGLFFGRDEGGHLRYNAPVLLICTLVVVVLSTRMIRDLIREQDAKRRGELEPYVDPHLAGTPARHVAP